jgi:hypothetical protein
MEATTVTLLPHQHLGYLATSNNAHLVEHIVDFASWKKQFVSKVSNDFSLFKAVATIPRDHKHLFACGRAHLR